MWFRRVEEIEDIPVPSWLHEHPELVSSGNEAPHEVSIQRAPVDKNKKEKYHPADFQRVRLLSKRRLERCKNERYFILQIRDCSDHILNYLRAIMEEKYEAAIGKLVVHAIVTRLEASARKGVTIIIGEALVHEIVTLLEASGREGVTLWHVKELLLPLGKHWYMK